MMPWQKDIFIKMAGMKKGEMKVAMAGRQIGKSAAWNSLAMMMANIKREDLKIKWDILSDRSIRANVRGNDQYFDMLTDSDMEPIQAWCEEHNCGTRTSFDTFKFKSKKQLTMFILRWAE